MMDTLAARRPQQARSRASFDRVLLAARDLLARRGYDSFTLQEVSRAAKVSIGSIYGRIDSKEHLIQVLHRAVLDDIEADQRALLAGDWAHQGLDVAVTTLINGFGDILRRYAGLLRPLMLRANSDRLISEAGVASYHKFFEQAVALLFTYSRDIHHPDPEKAVRFSLFIAYSAFRNFLGLGSTRGEAEDQDWADLKANVISLCLTHLSDGSPL